jgi:hypothetical protein
VRTLLAGLMFGALSVVLGLITLALTLMRAGHFAGATLVFILSAVVAMIFGMLLGSSELAATLVEEHKADRAALREQARLDHQWVMVEPDKLASSIDELGKAAEDKRKLTAAKTTKRSRP